MKLLLLGLILVSNVAMQAVADPIACVNQPMDIFDMISDFRNQQVQVKDDIDFLNQAAQLCDDIEFYFGDLPRAAKAGYLDEKLENVDVAIQIGNDYFRRLKVFTGKVANLLKFYDQDKPALQYQGLKLQKIQYDLKCLNDLLTPERVGLCLTVALIRQHYSWELRCLNTLAFKSMLADIIAHRNSSLSEYLTLLHDYKSRLQKKLELLLKTKPRSFWQKPIDELIMNLDQIEAVAKSL